MAQGSIIKYQKNVIFVCQGIDEVKDYSQIQNKMDFNIEKVWGKRIRGTKMTFRVQSSEKPSH